MASKKNKKRYMAGPDENNLEEVAKKFQSLINAPKQHPRPPNSISAIEYAERANIHYKTAADYLRKLYKDGYARRYKWGKMFVYVLEEDAENT